MTTRISSVAAQSKQVSEEPDSWLDLEPLLSDLVGMSVLTATMFDHLPFKREGAVQTTMHPSEFNALAFAINDLESRALAIQKAFYQVHNAERGTAK
ncbi:hypothetical protein [Devosia sp. RR2S18]|uniref:hypothetical protein n=1 Tax=Devosia rhizosphaerae TaxID=3049774 RepID=UPI0025421626|nr:hypothetical protein [Devosia sp. RR2S18]WIJ24986.1 hypothetical protein QOV41_18555 [Devosia sp. RR2S18]